MEKPLLRKYLTSLCIIMLFAFSTLAQTDGDANIPLADNANETWTFSHDSSIDLDDIDSKQPPAFYPNPVRDIVHLTHQENVARVRVISLTGKTLIDIKTQEKSINLSKLSKGMYLINFDMKDGKRIARKLVKK